MGTRSSKKAILEDLYAYLNSSVIKVSAIISFTTGVLSCISLLRGYSRITLLTFVIIFTVALGTVWLFLLHIYRKEVEVNGGLVIVENPSELHRYKYAAGERRLALIGITILPLCIVASFGWVMVRNFSAGETIIMVSNLRATGDERLPMSEQIRDRLRTIMPRHINLEIMKPGEDVVDENKTEIAEKMLKNNASMSFSGWYNVKQGQLEGKIYFCDSNYDVQEKILIGEGNLHATSGGDNVTEQVDEVTYRMALIIGRHLSVKKNYEEAVALFTAVAAQIERPGGETEPASVQPIHRLSASELYYQRGSAYFRLGRFDAALSDYDKALRVGPTSDLKDMETDLHYQSELCYLSLDSGSFVDRNKLKCAITEFRKARKIDHKGEQDDDYLRGCGRAYKYLIRIGEYDAPLCTEDDQRWIEEWVEQQNCQEQYLRR